VKLSRFLWTGVLLLLGTLLLWLLLAQLQRVAQHRDELAHPLPVIGQVAGFTLTNQNGQTVTLADLRGKVWVADIIFTRCTGPCMKMTRQMKELQDILPPGAEAKLVTLTSDPGYDTPRELKTYAERFKADTNRWWFLTGSKAEISKLAIDSLKLSVVEKKPEERETPADLFIHSTISVIVDRQSRLRGVFQTVGEGIDFQQVKADILKAVRKLEREG
jgi:cytochrome oxidase Cu insertion factor (SCO1/SenC/PrrC family)